MTPYRAFAAAILAAAALSACGRAENAAEAPSPAPAGATETAPWFICDVLDGPRVFVFRKTGDGQRVLMTEYEKPSGAPARRAEYALGTPEGAAGSLYTPLLREGVAAGNIRSINEGVLETPGAAYTPPIRSVDLGTQINQCRWLPRTRLLGVGERRSFVVHEDADGDLIYTVHDYADAASAEIVELGENARTTRFSLEVRGGQETVGPGGTEFRFENDGYLYLVVAPTSGPATLEVWRGNEQLQVEVLMAYQVCGGP